MLSRTDRLQMASQDTVAPPVPLIAPFTGWNTRDALDAMAESDAVQLDNWYPDASGVNVRNGFVPFASNVGTGVVSTLAEYNFGSIDKFLAAASGHIYDISAGGSTPTSLASGFTNDQWQTVSFLSRLFFVNGHDTMQVFDGATLTGGTFTGVSLATLVGCIQYQQRLFFWPVASTGFWFAPLNSISGALNFFDLAAFAPDGGNLIAATTFSHDGGNGVLDFIAFIMASGDCLMYYGNDPGDINNFQFIGRYRISPPVSPRAVCNYGAEAFLTTSDDHVPMQQQLVALKNGSLPPRSKISNAVQAAIAANGAGFGWQALYYPNGRRLIFNIPNTDGTFDQHIQNTGMSYIDQLTGLTTSPWCRFTNMNGACWGLFAKNLYFGTSGGKVFRADTGTLDNMGTISAVGQQSWNIFKSGLRKKVSAVRPLVSSLSQTSYSFSLAFDYADTGLITNDFSTPGGGSPWDTSPWNTSPWSPEREVSIKWGASGGTGVAVSPVFSMQSTKGAIWLRTDLRFEQGNYL